MRISFLDTYYPRFLAAQQNKFPHLTNQTYAEQKQHFINQLFGTSDFYSRHVENMGHHAEDLIVNCISLQKSWARENNYSYRKSMVNFPQYFRHLPLVGSFIQLMPELVQIAIEQIKQSKPDILYCQDLWFLTPNKLAEIRPYVKLIVGQIASPLPPLKNLKYYDLITTSLPNFIPRLRANGIATEYFRIGFDERVLEQIGLSENLYNVSFVGGISRHHQRALPFLEYLAKQTPIQFFGYGAESLIKSSPILRRHHGEVWGLDMYRVLSNSLITINRHINLSENFANNMRLFEATGVGAMLITDKKDNLGELFDIDKEVVAYSSKEEAVELVNYYLAHPEEASKIGKAGQLRTLREHTYSHRMKELMQILEKYLSKKTIY